MISVWLGIIVHFESIVIILVGAPAFIEMSFEDEVVTLIIFLRVYSWSTQTTISVSAGLII